MTIAEFQRLIRERYYATDSARGAAGTFLWFAEEVGELAKAIGQHERDEMRRGGLARITLDAIGTDRLPTDSPIAA